MKPRIVVRLVLLIPFAALVWLTSLAPARAATRRVPGDHPTILDAVLASASGDTVLVAPGTYRGDGNRDIHFAGVSLVVRSESGPEATVLELEGTATAPHRAFVFDDLEAGTAAIEGFTIQHGCGSIDPMLGRTAAGAIFIRRSAPRIADCVFVSNVSGDLEDPQGSWGGAIYTAEDGYPVIRGCVFSGNSATRGGAIACQDYGRPALVDCVFRENSARGSGGAVHIWSTDVSAAACRFEANSAIIGGAITVEVAGLTLTNCDFNGNRASAVGGAVLCDDAALGIDACTFTRNRAEDRGGALRLDGTAPLVERSLFAGNSAGTQGGAIECLGAWPTLSRCTFYENDAPQGGAVDCRGWGPILEGCTLAGNSASLYGAALLSGSESSAVLRGCIVAFHVGSSPAIYCADPSPATPPSLSCCDVYGNAGGDWVGCIEDQFGVEGNISADPLFCDREGADFSLDCRSPCAPAQQPDCGLIGAWDVGCGASAVETATWGLLKSIFERSR